MAPDRPLIDVLGRLPGRPSDQVQTERTRRLVLVGLVLLNALMVGVCVTLLFASKRGEIADAQSETLNDARLTEQATSALFDKAAIALGAVGVQVERQLSGGGTDASIFWSIVDSQVAQVAEIERIGVFDAQGAQLCGLPAERCQRLNIADRDYFQRLREHPDDPTTLYGPYESRPTGKPALVLARAMRLQDGRFAGVAIAVLPVERLKRLVTTPRMGPGGSVSLRRIDHALVLREPELTGPDAVEAGRRVTGTLKQAIASPDAEGGYVVVAPNDGVERATAYRKLEKYPYYVLVGRATEDFLAGWRRLVAWTAGFLLLFAATSWLLARATSASLRRHAQALTLYDEAPCGYHTLDSNGTFLSVNATELAWLRCTREEVVGKLKPTDFFTEEGRATFAANFPAFARTGVLEGLDLDLVSRDGTTRRVHVSATAVRDAHGAFLHSNSVMYDISELHEVRSQVQALAQQQGVMLDNDLIGMVRMKDRRTVWKNQAMDRIFGYSGAEWDDLPSRALYFDDETHQRMGVELQAALRQGQTYRVQLQMRRKDGHAIWIDASGARLPATSGEVMMMLADITPLKAAEEVRLKSAALEAQNFQLRETNRLKSELVANMSHELRTPLNAILGFGQMLEAGTVKPDSPKFASYIGRIVGSGKHLLGLIDQVLDYAKAESGRLSFDIESVSVANAVEEVVDLIHTESSARRIHVQVHVDPELNSVVADSMRLRQMLFALISNAVKFSNEAGKIEVSATALDETRWRLSVADQGIGIDDADVKRLFMPFVQLSSGATKTHGGTGIGLALVRLIARAQGGEIQVASQLGQGSTFTLTLPRDLDPLPRTSPMS